jgi:hypothetical protein
MNAKTRKLLKSAIETIEILHNSIETIRDEEQEKFDNLPEGLQQSENGQKFEETVGSLDEVISNLEDAIGNIDSVL